MEISDIYRLIKEGGFKISTDSRTVQKGDMYIALKGEQFDGNAYAQQALEKGAKYAIVDTKEFALDDRYIVVENSYDTLKELAKKHRQTFSIPVLAIGGSNGKTTTKELITAVLAKKYKVHTTKGNLNNEIGVPLTLLAIPEDTEIAVIEIGANHPGEHTRLMNSVLPTHILVTNNGMDHLEGFGTIEGVRKANKEIFDCAKDIRSKALVNKNLPDLMEDSSDLERMLYPEDVVQSDSTLQAELIYAGTVISSQLFGSFNEANILAAIAVGKQFEVPITDAAAAIKNYQPTLKRSQIIEKDGHTIIMDCYNANPTSMELALQDFFHATEPGKRIVIVGDMLEVGETEHAAHGAILNMIEKMRDADDVVICVGVRLSLHQDSFATDLSFHFFPTPALAKDFFDTLNLTDKKIFLKASRGIKLEDILANSSFKQG